jgi:regulator of replication initiation timing
MSQKNNLTAWGIVALVGLLGLNAYQWFSNNQLKTINNEQTAISENLKKAQAELDQDYQTALEDLEKLKGSNNELNALIDSQKGELEIQKAKISDLIWSKRELGKAQEEIKKLNTRVADTIAELTKMKEENKVLTDKNTLLTSENQTLSKDLSSVTTEKEELAATKATLVTEKEYLSKTNEALSSKVDIASAIKINSMTVQGFEIEKNGKLDKQSKAKNVDLLRFCLDTEANSVTPAGAKKFYVRVVSPVGETVAVEDRGSGVLTNKQDNSQVRYTTSGEVAYDNKATNACIDWTLANPIAKGLYEVEIFNNGFLVGKSTFQLK